MAIYTIGDLHLSFSENKPMSIFGENWKGHEEKVKDDWNKKVKENEVNQQIAVTQMSFETCLDKSLFSIFNLSFSHFIFS